MSCKTNNFCSVATVDSSICNIFSIFKVTDSNTIYSPTATIYVKNANDEINNYLTHYWPFNGDYKDVVSNAHLYNGMNDSLVTDRFGRPNSSLYLNYGSLQAPSGNYIYGDFTITTWVKMFTFESYRRFFAQKTPSTSSYIFFCFTGNGNGKPYYITNSGEKIGNTSLIIGKWQHLAFTIKGSILSIYIDGICIYNNLAVPFSVENFTHVYFGTEGIRYTNAEIDDIKIYNKSLTQTELVQSLWDKF